MRLSRLAYVESERRQGALQAPRAVPINSQIIERFYQKRAIRRIAESFERENLILDHLTEHGIMDPALLYESPFIDKSPRGPEGLFSSEQVEQLVGVLRTINERAAA